MKDPTQRDHARTILVALSAALVAAACLPDEENDDEKSRNDRGDSGWYYYSYTTTGSGQRGFGPEDVEVNLTGESVTIRQLDDARSFAFGMAQTGDCTDDCWVAESCGADPFGPSICHDVPPTGLTLVPVSAADQVLPSTTTRVGPELLSNLTFIIDDGTQCYTWGHDPSYYAVPFGCTVW